VGAWTCISMQLNSKARMGFDNSTVVLRLCSCSCCSSSPACSIATAAGFTARTLNENDIRVLEFK